MQRPCQDHDHKTGVIRGWLCIGCNVTLGKVKDDPSNCVRRANHLERLAQRMRWCRTYLMTYGGPDDLVGERLRQGVELIESAHVPDGQDPVDSDWSSLGTLNVSRSSHRGALSDASTKAEGPDDVGEEQSPLPV